MTGKGQEGAGNGPFLDLGCWLHRCVAELVRICAILEIYNLSVKSIFLKDNFTSGEWD